MVSPNGRTRQQAHLPAKIEHAYRESSIKRGNNKTSRLDYAAGYEDGYEDALVEVWDSFTTHLKRLRKELRAPAP